MSVFRNLMGAQKKGGILPAGYTQLEYIETDDNKEYINIQYNAKGDLYVKLKVKGSLQATSNIVFSYNNGTIGSAWFGYKDKYTNGGTISKESSNIVVEVFIYFDSDSINVTINGYTFSRTGVKSQAGLCSLLTGGQFYAKNCRLYYCEIIDKDNEKVRNLIPCINPSNEVGMYDLVSQQFFGNSGAGEFIAGPVIV